MKRINLQWIIMLWLLIISSISSPLFAQNMDVSGAGTADANGTYIRQAELQNGKPRYIKDGDTNWTIEWKSTWWTIVEMGWMDFTYYSSNEDVATPDLVTTWQVNYGSSPVPTVSQAGRGLSYSSTIFLEHENNDGSIANSIIITYNEFGGDFLTGDIDDDFVVGNKVTVTNVPAGLTAQIIKTAANQLTFTLGGNAIIHDQDTRILDVSIVFQNSAFDQEDASDVGNYSMSNIELLYLTTFSGGSGTEGDPFLISNKMDLKRLTENWSGDQWTKHFKQTSNIAFESSDFEEGGDFYNGGQAWSPIGTSDNRFLGVYDGNDYEISGFEINRGESNYVGFWGIIGNGGFVKNLGLVIGADGIVGKFYVGGFVGSNHGGTIENCYTNGKVSGYNSVGGFVGLNYEGTIENCYAEDVIVSGNDRYIGGFVGINWKNIRKSYAIGNVIVVNSEISIGGFVGQSVDNATISDCYAKVEVSGNTAHIGGFAGINNGKLNNSYSTGKVTSGGSIQTDKGFCGTASGSNLEMSGNFWDVQTSEATSTAGTATGKTTAEMKTQSTFTNWDFENIWAMDIEKNDGYPYLQWQDYVPPVVAPTSQATNLIFSNSVSGEVKNSILSWTASHDAERYLVLRKTSSSPTFAPADNIEYTAGTTQGDAYVVYSGDAVTATDANLSAGIYYYKIYAYNGSGGSSKYLTANPLSGYTIFSTDGTVNIPNTGTDPVSTGFPNAGVNITFPNGTSGTDLTVTKTNSVPASNFAALPGVKGMKNLYFTITSDPSSAGTYTLILDFSSLTGMDEAKWNNFKIMKRTNVSSPWQDVTQSPLNGTITNRQTDGVWGKFTITGLSSFSEFGGGEGAETIIVTSNSETGAGTLKQAIADAIAGDIITFDSPMTITLTSPVVIDKNLTIRGVNGGVTLDGDGETTVMIIEDAKVVRLDKLIITGGAGEVGYAGGIWNNGDLTMINCVVAGNTETGNEGAGGIIQYSEGGDDPNDVLNLVNTTITNNSGISGFDDGIGGLSAVTGEVNIYNTIIWGNTGDGYDDVDETITIAEAYNSCIGNLGSLTITTGEDNISSDPQFVGIGGSAAHPYSISGTSPCADAGDNSYSFETTDIKGDGRKLLKTNGAETGTIDMGAYEFNSENPLPVELTSFSAEVTSKKVLLTWQTATEVNNYGFEVQRSVVSDQRSEEMWEKVGFVEGSGNSNSPKEYSFADESVTGGKYSYRLKQIDSDGSFSYSETVEVEVSNIPTEFVLYQNYPNPFNPSTTIKFGIPADSKVMLEVFNILGEKVATLVNKEMQAGYHQIEFSGIGIASGIYLYRLTAGDFKSTKKFILMK